MDIQAYEQELLDNIEELENEIEALKQELLEQPEYEEDITSDIQRCYDEIKKNWSDQIIDIVYKSYVRPYDEELDETDEFIFIFCLKSCVPPEIRIGDHAKESAAKL